MKKLTLIFITLLSSVSLVGQLNLTVQQLLDKTSEVFKSAAVETKFSSTVTRYGRVESYSDGTLWVKGDQFVLETEEMKTWYNGKYQWSLIFEMEEVNLSEPTQAELEEINPYELLKLSKRGYSVKYMDSSRKNVLLKAKDKKKNYQEVKVSVNEQLQPTQIEVTTKDNQLINIEVRSFKSNTCIDSDFFSFSQDEYPEVEIIDLR